MKIKHESIGYLLGETIQFPEKTIKGRDYSRPTSTIGLEHGYFAALDTFGNSKEEIEELRAIVDKAMKPKTKKYEGKKDVRTKD